MTLTGTTVPRKEDPRLLRGRGAFADGFHARGQYRLQIVGEGQVPQREPDRDGQARRQVGGGDHGRHAGGLSRLGHVHRAHRAVCHGGADDPGP